VEVVGELEVGVLAAVAVEAGVVGVAVSPQPARSKELTSKIATMIRNNLFIMFSSFWKIFLSCVNLQRIA
jgi:hypothetical protein